MKKLWVIMALVIIFLAAAAKPSRAAEWICDKSEPDYDATLCVASRAGKLAVENEELQSKIKKLETENRRLKEENSALVKSGVKTLAQKIEAESEKAELTKENKGLKKNLSASAQKITYLARGLKTAIVSLSVLAFFILVAMLIVIFGKSGNNTRSNPGSPKDSEKTGASEPAEDQSAKKCPDPDFSIGRYFNGLKRPMTKRKRKWNL